MEVGRLILIRGGSTEIFFVQREKSPAAAYMTEVRDANGIAHGI